MTTLMMACKIILAISLVVFFLIIFLLLNSDKLDTRFMWLEENKLKQQLLINRSIFTIQVTVILMWVIFLLMLGAVKLYHEKLADHYAAMGEQLRLEGEELRCQGEELRLEGEKLKELGENK